MQPAQSNYSRTLDFRLIGELARSFVALSHRNRDGPSQQLSRGGPYSTSSQAVFRATIMEVSLMTLMASTCCMAVLMWLAIGYLQRAQNTLQSKPSQSAPGPAPKMATEEPASKDYTTVENNYNNLVCSMHSHASSLPPRIPPVPPSSPPMHPEQ